MASEGMVNVGQLARQAYGQRDVALVGFSSYKGSVIAGQFWDAPWQRMPVPAARSDSWEAVLHEAGDNDKLLLFPENSHELTAWRGHRAIGVVYRPKYEQYGNYVPTILPKRYDALLYLDETAAVHPLISAEQETPEDVPETYPTGM